MKIHEAIGPGVDSAKLVGLVSFLAGRADDTGAPKEISQDAFIRLANDLDINVTKPGLADLVNQPPLNNLLEPLTPDSQDPIRFKGAGTPDTAMPVNKAQDIVASAAKSAMRRDRSV